MQPKVFDSVLGSYRKVTSTISPAGGFVISMLAKIKKAKKRPYSVNYPALPEVEPIAGISVTARLQETYHYHSEATQFTVESGQPLTDHVIKRPVRVEIEFEVSNIDDGVQKAAGVPAKPAFYKAKSALEKFINLWEKREPITLMTTHTMLKDMVCVSLQPDNQAPEWGKLRFRASFQQIKRIQLQSAIFSAAKLNAGIVKTASEPQSGGIVSEIAQGTEKYNGKISKAMQSKIDAITSK